MLKRTISVAIVLSVIGFIPASSVRADDVDKKTVITFSQPVEIPGQVLPAGTYTFKILDSRSDRHVVQIFNADGSKLVATVLTIANQRLTATDETVIRFAEAAAGSPEVLRAWFYPGNTIGEEFVYSRERATQLATASKVAVPAIAVNVDNGADLVTVPLMTITPDQSAVAVASDNVAGRTVVASTRQERAELPKTAGSMALMMVLAFASITMAIGLLVFAKRALAPASF